MKPAEFSTDINFSSSVVLLLFLLREFEQDREHSARKTLSSRHPTESPWERPCRTRWPAPASSRASSHGPHFPRCCANQREKSSPRGRWSQPPPLLLWPSWQLWGPQGSPPTSTQGEAADCFPGSLWLIPTELWNMLICKEIARKPRTIKFPSSFSSVRRSNTSPWKGAWEWPALSFPCQSQGKAVKRA